MTQLVTTPFGATGMDITRIGLGAWAIGGGDWESGWGPQPDPLLSAAGLELTDAEVAEIVG